MIVNGIGWSNTCWLKKSKASWGFFGAFKFQTEYRNYFYKTVDLRLHFVVEMDYFKRFRMDCVLAHGLMRSWFMGGWVIIGHFACRTPCNGWLSRQKEGYPGLCHSSPIHATVSWNNPSFCPRVMIRIDIKAITLIIVYTFVGLCKLLKPFSL